MMPLEDYIKTLTRFGFTENQAKVYLTIVQLGLAPVGSISRILGVRREEVYRILPKLEQMGLVEKILSTPIKLKAIPLEDAFSILVRQRQDEVNRQLSDLASRAKEFLRYFKTSYDGSLQENDEAQFSLISGKPALMSRINAIIGKTKSEIDVIDSIVNLSRFLFNYAESFQEAIKKGVKIKIITEIPDDKHTLQRNIEKQVTAGNLLELRYSDKIISRYIIADNIEALFSTSMEAEDPPILWTNNNSLIALLRKDFTNLWGNSSF